MTTGTAIVYLIGAIGAVVGIGGSIWLYRITNRLYPPEKKDPRAKS